MLTAENWARQIFIGLSSELYKQWGKILGDTVNLKIINFPVSFNECFGGLALFNGDPVAAAECATITDITNTNFKIYMYANNAGTGYANANIFYLFLGAQPQWGYCSSRTATFPIPFPASALFIVAVPKTTSTSATATGAEYLGTTSVNLYLHELRVGISQAAIEQWGINSAGNNGSEGESGWYAFPVNFNSACFALFCGLRNTDTNKTYTNKIMAVIHGLVVSFGLLLADSQPVTSYNPTATL